MPKVVQTILDANNKISQNNSVVNTDYMQKEEKILKKVMTIVMIHHPVNIR